MSRKAFKVSWSRIYTREDCVFDAEGAQAEAYDFLIGEEMGFGQEQIDVEEIRVNEKGKEIVK